MKITQAIIPAAGFGTRFLPFTKAVPKEMLPLLSKPAIQIIAEEISAAGIDHCIMITARYKKALEDFFKAAPHLDLFLAQKKKEDLMAPLNDLIKKLSFSYIYQDEAKGLGHAILMAKGAITDDYFGILLPDDIIIHPTPGIGQLMAVAQKYKASVIAVQEVPASDISAYGVVAYKNQLAPDLFEVSGLVEKPKADQAPSNLAIIGRYVLSSRIFDELKDMPPSIGGEIQLTDGMAAMLKGGERILAYKIQGIRHDIGNPTGWLKANLHYAQLQNICL